MPAAEPVGTASNAKIKAARMMFTRLQSRVAPASTALQREFAEYCDASLWFVAFA